MAGRELLEQRSRSCFCAGNDFGLLALARHRAADECTQLAQMLAKRLPFRGFVRRFVGLELARTFVPALGKIPIL